MDNILFFYTGQFKTVLHLLSALKYNVKCCHDKAVKDLSLSQCFQVTADFLTLVLFSYHDQSIKLLLITQKLPQVCPGSHYSLSLF